MRLLSAGRSVLLCAIVMMGMPAASLFAQTTAPGELGSVAIRVLPPTAEIFIDGERWVSPENSTGLVVQLPPGRHTIEIRARGCRVFSTLVDVRRGETTPLNVSLSGGSSTPGSGAEAVPAAPVAPGPITQSVSDDGYAIAPDFRVTQLGHRTTAFAGVYGGRVFDRRLLVGAGGYWLTHAPSGVSNLAYGGAVVEWRVWSDRALGFNLHGLAGYGQARSERTFTFDPRRVQGPRDDERAFHGDEGFFVGEPEFQVVARFATHLSLKAGVGYRLTSLHDNDLGGASGSISIQFGR
jgi:PEGA domain